MSSEEEENGRLESDSLREVWIEPMDALWSTTTQRAIRFSRSDIALASTFSHCELGP